MHQNTFMLLATAVLGTLATFFAIVGVGAPGWPRLSGSPVSSANRTSLLSSNNISGYTSAGVLLIIAIVILIIASLLTFMFLREFINDSSDRIKGLLLFFFVLAGIFIMSAYSRAVSIDFYSYHLSVVAGILNFISIIFFTYWLGRTSVRI
jgi:hypothetical protein